MRPDKQMVLFGSYLIAVFTGLLLCGSDALAAESVKNWRSTFDLVMRWLNFVIIAFVLVKFGRKPIKDFLSNRRQEIDHKIKKFKQQKQATEEKIEEATKMLKDSMDRFEKIKKRIVEGGEKKKHRIIENARQESRILLEGTKQKIKNQILEASNTIRSEIIESAIAKAEKRLPEEITAVDEQKLLGHFMESTAAK
ncbi:MAG: ATP synthase F0 subunit B [Desulfobacterales bacterium]|jgi:F-type H+-transporting ATPase subunit b